MTMEIIDKAKDFADDHDKQVDVGFVLVGDQVDKRTGDKYSTQVDKGVDAAQQHTGEGDSA